MHIGFLDELRNEPAVLILGDAPEFLWLADIVGSRWTGSFSSLPQVELAGIDLDLSYSVGLGKFERNGPNFRWTLSDAEVREFSGRLRGLANGNRPGHAYLDTPARGGDIQVVASMGEYDPSVFQGL